MILVVFGLAGYIVYDKFIAEEPNDTKVEENPTSKSETSILEDEYALAIGKILYDKASTAMKNGDGFDWEYVGMKEDFSCIHPDGEGCYTVLTNYDTYMDTVVTAKVKKEYESKNENITRIGDEVRVEQIVKRAGNIVGMTDEVKLVGKSSDKLEFKILTRECDDYDNYITTDICKDKDIKVTGSYNLIIIKQNGNWFIDEMPIFLGGL